MASRWRDEVEAGAVPPGKSRASAGLYGPAASGPYSDAAKCAWRAGPATEGLLDGSDWLGLGSGKTTGIVTHSNLRQGPSANLRSYSRLA
jgi:hypothetical protein